MQKISLEAKALLKAREQRFYIKQHFLAQSYARTCIEMGMNIPGLPKLGDHWQRVFDVGLERVQQKFELIKLEKINDMAGYYALIAIDQEARKAKFDCCEIEASAPWSRLLDIDCIGQDGRISRQSLGMRERSCFVCKRFQDDCIASKRHLITTSRSAAERLAKTINEI